MNDQVNLDELLDALNYVPKSHYEYEDWLRVGMALKVGGADWTDWDKWSRMDPAAGRYKSGLCEEKWASFDTDEVTPKTIFQWAMDGGWSRRHNSTGAYALGWEDEITSPVNLDTSGEIQVSEPANWNPFDQVRTYIKALFHADEYVAYNTFLRHDAERGRWTPADSGTYTRTAGQILSDLDKYEASGDLSSALGSLNPEGGAYIRFNPVDGHGVNDKNVTRYTYTLIESDSMSIERQLYMMHALKLPIRIIVHSGGKSLHAIVKVDAANKYEYRDRVEYLHKVCNDNGLQADPADKNESRLSRLPGVMRGGKKQYIVDGETGLPSWAEWYEWQESLKDKLPKVQSLADIFSHEIVLAPELIKGVLRRGHKMIISGPSKAGKSFALLELALAIAEGRTWMGNECVQGKVLYVNMEIDGASFANRFAAVYGNGNSPAKEWHTGNIDIWNMRGYSMPLSKLLDPLIRRSKGKEYSAIIIDPLYKVLDGDENSNSDVSKMVAQFDRITEETGAAVIYAHHFAKGVGGDRDAIDRGAGAGTFARDPDAILTMVPLDAVDQKEHPKGSAWRIEYVLREFPVKDPDSIWWDYPVHTLSPDLDDAQVVTSMTKAERSKENARKQKRQIQEQDTHDAVNDVIREDGTFELSDFWDAYCIREQVTKNTAATLLRRYGYIETEKKSGMPTIWKRPDSHE